MSLDPSSRDADGPAPKGSPGSEKPPHVPLSQALSAMIAKGDSETIRIGALVEGTEERGFYLVMILLSVPFVSPVPLPGLSTVVGVAIAFMSCRVAWRLAPRLPSFLGDREISRARMESFVRKTSAALRMVEKVVKPRFGGWMTWPGVRFLNAMLLALMGVLLALPLPPVLPFSNSLPCWGIILIAFAVMERDGILIWLGYLVAVGTFIYLAFFTSAVFVGLHRLFEWIRTLIGT